jgi:N-acyl homoserine lactone hydrolase
MKVARSIEGASMKALTFSDTPYLGFSMSCDVWGDGSLVMVPAPGHTPGSVVAFVALPSGQRIAFIGDIVWQMEGLDREVPKPWLSRLVADYAPAEVLDLIHRLAELKRQMPEMLFVPAHDQKMMGQLPLWPRTTLLP